MPPFWTPAGDVPSPGYTAAILTAESANEERRQGDRRRRREIRADRETRDRAAIAAAGWEPGQPASPYLAALRMAEFRARMTAAGLSWPAPGSGDPPPPGQQNAGVSGALDNTTPKVAKRSAVAGGEDDAETEVKARQTRQNRYRLQAGVARVTRRRRVQWCGQQRLGETVDVAKGPDGRAHFQGVMRCANRWVCPECAARIGYQDARDVETLVERHLAIGGGIAFQTLTMPHDWGDDLAGNRSLVARGWQYVQRHRRYKDLRRQLGIQHFVRSLEVTHGASGWHPHLHILLLTKEPLTAGQLEALQRTIYAAWRDSIVAGGQRPPRRGLCPIKNGLHGVGEYISKLGAALEMVRWDKKVGRRQGRTSFQIAQDYLADKRPADLALWRDWEKGTRGARAITWSRGLRDLYGIIKRSDKAKAEPMTTEVILELEPRVWSAVRQDPEGLCAILEAAETGGADSAVAAVLTVARQREAARRLLLRPRPATEGCAAA